MSRSPSLRDWFERAEPDGRGWISIAQVPFVRKRAAVDQVLMAGDAAGLIAPLAGDGIAMALAGGALAGRRVRDYLAGDLPGERLPAEYARAWERRFAGRIRLSYRLQALLLHPQWARAAFGVLRAAPGLGRYLVLKTRGMDWTV